MPTWYVDSAAGAGGSGSELSPFDSIADLRTAGVAAGDTINLTGTFRGGNEYFEFTGPNGLTIQRWPGRARPMIRGEVLIAQTPWTVGAANEYNKNVGVIATTGSTTLGSNDNGASSDTFTRSSGSFVTDGFRSGDLVQSSGFATSNGIFRVATVTDLTLTIASGQALATEAPAAGRTVSVIFVSVVEDWETQFKAPDGGKGGWQISRHQGHMPRGTLGALAAGQHHYDGDTGVLTVRARDSANLNANPTAHQYAYCERSLAPTNQAVFFISGDSSGRLVTFRGLDFALWPAFDSYNIRCHNMDAGSIIDDCTSWDFGGFHCFGFASWTRSACKILNCLARGHNTEGGTCNAFVIAATNADDGAVSHDNVISGCVFHAYGLLDTAGNLVPANLTSGGTGTWSTGSSILSISHSETNSFMGRFSLIGCAMVADYSESGVVGHSMTLHNFSDQHSSTVPANPAVPSQYGVRVERCTYHGHGIGVVTGSTAVFVGRCHFDLTDSSINTAAGTVHFRALAAGQSMYLEACTLVYSNEAAANQRLIDLGGSTAFCAIVLCSIYNSSVTATSFRSAITRLDSAGDVGATLYCRQSIFKILLGGAATPLFYTFEQASPDPVSSYNFDSCWYDGGASAPTYGSPRLTVDTQAEWAAVVDVDDATSAPIYEVDPQFTNPAAGDLSPLPGGNLISTVFTLPELVGVVGINGKPYDGHYGAYQFGESGNPGVGGGARGLGLAFDEDRRQA